MLQCLDCVCPVSGHNTVNVLVCLRICCAECTSFAQPHSFLRQASVHGRLPTKLKLHDMQLCTDSSCIALI